ncbi:hypothetical protein Ciccas_008493 [Cichlidogyrus casuarinus]|uniref:RRM domain-containing protein n=1 Tax=Cichlidogyrus casuarinus TaxID=1844966 RepID=A0ABD2Q129_9PLAT
MELSLDESVDLDATLPAEEEIEVQIGEPERQDVAANTEDQIFHEWLVGFTYGLPEDHTSSFALPPRISASLVTSSEPEPHEPQSQSPAALSIPAKITRIRDRPVPEDHTSSFALPPRISASLVTSSVPEPHEPQSQSPAALSIPAKITRIRDRPVVEPPAAMVKYHLKFDPGLSKDALETALKGSAGFRSLTFIFDKFKGTPRGYAFAAYNKAVESPVNKVGVYDIIWTEAKPKQKRPTKSKRPGGGGGRRPGRDRGSGTRPVIMYL